MRWERGCCMCVRSAKRGSCKFSRGGFGRPRDLSMKQAGYTHYSCLTASARGRSTRVATRGGNLAVLLQLRRVLGGWPVFAGLCPPRAAQCPTFKGEAIMPEDWRSFIVCRTPTVHIVLTSHICGSLRVSYLVALDSGRMKIAQEGSTIFGS